MLLLGMGGSSLCPEVFSLTFGKQPGSPELLVLDSTDPVYIRHLRTRIDPARTLFCVSSKSGTTLEPNIYMQYFFDETKKVVGDRAGHHFIAITDPGSKLEQLAKERKAAVFSGEPTIGGRYSALSPFGLVPAALMGIDVARLLDVLLGPLAGGFGFGLGLAEHLVVQFLSVPASLLDQAFVGSGPNPSYGLTFWLNRQAPGAREIDYEKELDLKWQRAHWTVRPRKTDPRSWAFPSRTA